MGWAMAVLVAPLLLVLLMCGIRWYLKRARRISAVNGERRDFQHGLLLELQDIRTGVDGELASALDHLIDIVRHSTPARNAETEEYDARIAED